MARFWSHVSLSLLLLAIPISAHAQAWSGIISPSRATDWSKVGVPGGIPSGSWTQCSTAACTALATPASVTAANINTAIAGASANTYVLLPAGTFAMSTGIIFNVKNNVELRGSGADQTFLVFSGNNGCQGLAANICFQSTDTNYYGSPSNVANWTAGYAAGTSIITLSSTVNLSIGHAIMLDQTDDTSTSDTGAIFVCYTPQGVCSTNGDNGGSPRPNRSQEQMVTVTSINGNSVGISPPIVMPNWTSSKTPQAWWATNPILGSGVKDLSITIGSSAPNSAIAFFNCVGCWARGVRVVGPPVRSHVSIYLSNHITVQDSYFYKTNDSASVNYGIEVAPGSDDLIQNNIFEQIQAPYPSNGSATGSVYGYNFDVNNVFSGGTFQNQSGFPHAVGDEHILYEGNIGAGIYSDNFHGTHHFQTIFRNYWNGYQKNEGNLTTSATTPLIIDAFSRFYNIIGNVLGNPARHAAYTDLINAYGGSIGNGDGVPFDSNTPSTLLRWGNYANCSGSSPCNTSIFSTSEVPSGLTGAQALFTNPVPSSNTLPASFYLTSQPSWWTSGKPWPAIGPDVTSGNVKYCTGGPQTGTYVVTAAQCPSGAVTTLAGGRVVSNPAMDCYLNTMGGAPDGTGNVLSFNANACYGQSTSAGPPPQPPSGLNATVITN